MRGVDGPPETKAPPNAPAPNGPRVLQSRAPRRTSSGEAVALVQQEMSNLKALKRLSIGNVLSPLDPDLPAFVESDQHRDWNESDRALRIPEKSLHRSASTPERSERQRPQMHRQLSVSETSTESSADADMLWVPAHVHPEIAPNEWRSFVENKVEEIRHTMSGPARAGEPAAGSRLSHEIADQSDYMDASEMLEKKRRSSSGDKRRSILEMSTQLKSLGELESLASLSGEASEERNWQPPSHGALLRRSGGSSRRRNRPELRRPSSPTVGQSEQQNLLNQHEQKEPQSPQDGVYLSRASSAHHQSPNQYQQSQQQSTHQHQQSTSQPSESGSGQSGSGQSGSGPKIISPTERSVLNLTPRQRVRHEMARQEPAAEHERNRERESAQAPASAETLHYARQHVPMERRTAPLPAIPNERSSQPPQQPHKTQPHQAQRTDRQELRPAEGHPQSDQRGQSDRRGRAVRDKPQPDVPREEERLRHDRQRHGRHPSHPPHPSHPQPNQPHSQVHPPHQQAHQPQAHQHAPQAQASYPPQAQPQAHQQAHLQAQQQAQTHPSMGTDQSSSGPGRKQRPINLNIDVGPNPYRLDSTSAPSPGPVSAPMPATTTPVSPSGMPPASATVAGASKTSPPEPKEEKRRWRWLKDGKDKEMAKDGKDKDAKDGKEKDKEVPASPTAQMFSNLFKKKKKEPENQKPDGESDSPEAATKPDKPKSERTKPEPVTWAQQAHHTVVTQGRPGHMRQRSRVTNIPQDSKYEPHVQSTSGASQGAHTASHSPSSASRVVKADRRRPDRRGRSRTREDRREDGRDSGAGGDGGDGRDGEEDSKIQLPYAIPAHQISDRSQVMMYHRFPLHIERAIYRLSHMKLANPRRPLHQQVLLSNFMYAYLNLINQGYQRQMEGSEEEPLAIEGYDESNMSDDDMAQPQDANEHYEDADDHYEDADYGESYEQSGFDFYRAHSSSSSSEDEELNEEIGELWDEQHSEFDTSVRVSINGH